MKKMMVWAVLLCLLLTACANTPASPQMNEGQPTTVSTTTSLNGQLCRSPGLTINGIDEYNEFVNHADLPEDFVYYESLTHLGEFRGLVIFSQKIDKYHAKDYSSYYYSFIDKKGNKLYLDVGHRNDGFKEMLTPMESKYWGDMQAGDPTMDYYKHGLVIVRNGVEYIYLSNYLDIIAWEVDGIPFMLSTSCEGDIFIFYPEDGPLTFVQELMHTDTNKAALERFEASLNAPVVK